LSDGSEFHRSDAATGKERRLTVACEPERRHKHAAAVTMKSEVGGDRVGRRRELSGSDRVALDHSDSKIYNGNILATFCANTMKMGAVTPEITRVINAPFWMRRQKSAYLTNYWIDLHRFSVGRCTYGDYKTYIHFHGSPRDFAMVTD